MSVSTTEFRSLGKASQLPDLYVNPYYVGDLKRRVSVARVGGKLYAFSDLCTHEGCHFRRGNLSARRSCAPAMGRSSMSRRARWCGVQRSRRWRLTRCAE